MKLIGEAPSYPDVIESGRALIERIERHLGSIEIWAGRVPDWEPGFGWTVRPEDENKVLVMDGYNWGPGSGPRATLRECLESIAGELECCRAVIVGKPGLHGVHVPKPELR